MVKFLETRVCFLFFKLYSTCDEKNVSSQVVESLQTGELWQ